MKTTLSLLVLGCWLLANMAQAQRLDDGLEQAWHSPRLYLEARPLARDPYGLGYYRITAPKVIGWGITSLGGFVDGVLEGYQFDGRKSFERKWGADPYGFWGSQSWRMIYRDGDPANGPKSKMGEWLGAKDFYHVADDTRKLSYLGGSVLVGIGGANVNAKWWHYFIDFGVSFAASAFAKSQGMEWVRH